MISILKRECTCCSHYFEISQIGQEKCERCKDLESVIAEAEDMFKGIRKLVRDYVCSIKGEKV